MAKPSEKPKLFVAEESENKVLVFDPTAPSPSPEAVISKGISAPWGLAVDRDGNLYVANTGNRSVTVYRPGKTKPGFRIDAGPGVIPGSLAVDSQGNLFVGSTLHRQVVAYHLGRRQPYETVKLKKGTPWALAVDADDNLYVADDKYVLELPRGATKAIDLQLTGLDGAEGIAFANGLMYVSNYTWDTVTVYKKGQKDPFRQFSTGYGGPTFSTFVRPDEFFQAMNIGWRIDGYKSGHAKPFVTITNVQRPLGVASTPLQNP